MNYKELFRVALLLISSPARAWEEISFEDKRKVLIAFVYPLIGLCGLSVFIGSLLQRGWSEPQNFQFAMTQCCEVAVALFGGYFVSAYLINSIFTRFYRHDDDLLLCRQLAGYSMVVLLLVQLISGILTNFQIIGFLMQFYTFFVVWEGVKRLMPIRENEYLHFTLLASLSVLLSPVAIGLVFRQLTKVLN